MYTYNILCTRRGGGNPLSPAPPRLIVLPVSFSSFTVVIVVAVTTSSASQSVLDRGRRTRYTRTTYIFIVRDRAHTLRRYTAGTPTTIAIITNNKIISKITQQFTFTASDERLCTKRSTRGGRPQLHDTRHSRTVSNSGRWKAHTPAHVCYTYFNTVVTRTLV